MQFIKKIFARVWAFLKGIGGYARRHKIQAGVVVVVLAGLAYWGYTSYQAQVTTAQYVLTRTRLASIEQTVTGSGQVASEHQLNLSPKTSGAITSVQVKAGDTVVAGQVVATVDATDANKTLRDAKANLEGARISYAQSTSNNSDSQTKASQSAFSANTSAYADMGTVLSGIDTIFNGNEVSGSFATKNVYAYSKLMNDNAQAVEYRDRALAALDDAKTSYRLALATYNQTTRDADPQTLATLTDQTYDALLKVADAAKDANDYVNYIHMKLVDGDQDIPNIMASHLTSLGNYVSTTNSDTTSVASAKSDLSSAIATGGSGVTLDQQSAQLALTKAENAYQDAADAYEDTIVRAPFPGTIANVALQVYDQAGSGTTVATLITKQQYATLSLNEVDAAKVRAGEKATLTFDAIDGLTLDGTVAEVDTVGTVSQGVVSYTVKIGFDTQDDRILPGMTVDATIITASKDSALVVPSGAIKTQGTQSYVEVATLTNPSALPGGAQNFGSTSARFRAGSTTAGAAFGSTTRQFGGGSTTTARSGATGGLTVDVSAVTTKRVYVTIGITNDTMSEITSGVNPGDLVVSQSLNSSGKTTTQAKSLFSLFGGAGARTGAAGATGAGARTTTGAAGARAGGAAGGAGFTRPTGG